MRERRIGPGAEPALFKKTKGDVMLTFLDAKLFKLRMKKKDSVSKTILKLVEPVLSVIEGMEPGERRALFDDYRSRVTERAERGARFSVESSSADFTPATYGSPFTIHNYSVSRMFMNRIRALSSQSGLTRDALMDGIISDALNLRI